MPIGCKTKLDSLIKKNPFLQLEGQKRLLDWET